MRIANTSCCGLQVLSGLSEVHTPVEAMLQFCASKTIYWDCGLRMGGPGCSHVIFSAADGRGDYGDAFAAYITKHKLGTVTPSLRKKNPNSGNPLKVWVWTLDRSALTKWYAKHRAK